ncbi:DUF4126 domain-containing protein [Verrucomicrobiales bacterium]|jgi:hypothetical protein|nr:DUF4126 domain-containing protein [Verrucomicrobiales bacterium]
MEVLETLAVALGFATLAGLNLYLVVLLTGMAINQGWVDVSVTYPDLMALGDPAVITAAGVFFCLEFFSDKVPWVDSLWDTVHTLIRPVGGGILAIQTLGPTEPGFEVIIAMLAGGTTLVAHSFKAGTRLAINASPEPFTNVAASVTEDMAVVGGLALMSMNPILAGGACLLFLGFALFLTPKLLRRIKGFMWLVWNKVFAIVNRPDEEKLLYANLTSTEVQQISSRLGKKIDPAWSAKVLVGKAKRFNGFTAMTFGRIIAEAETPDTLQFVGSKFWRTYDAELSLEGLEITQEPRLFYEDIVLYSLEGTRKLVLRLPSGHREMANRIVESLISQRDAAMPMPSDRIMMAEVSENAEVVV